MARSMVNQNLYLKKETTPGVANVTGMVHPRGLKIRPGFTDNGEGFKASGSKVETAWVRNDEVGAPTVEAIQDFNAFTWLLCGGFGAPAAPTQPDAATAPDAWEWNYTLDPFNADPRATFTAIWGDAAQAVQMLQLFFQSLQLGVQRGGSLSLTSTAMSESPTFGATIPSVGVVDVPSRPVGQKMWDIYADDDVADLGMTKLLAAYEGGVNFSDKYTMDYVINSEVPSFAGVLEAEDTSYDGNLRVGFDATAVALANTFQAGTVKFVRFAATGPIIAGDVPYSLAIDLALRITARGEISSAPSSSAVSLPFTHRLTVDEGSGFAASAKLINTVAAI